MKLMRYSRKHEPSALARLGILVGHDVVADLRAGYALYLVDDTGNSKGRELAAVYMPPYIAQFLHMGEAAWLALGDAYTYLTDLAQAVPDAVGLNGEHLFIPLAECRLYAPLRPSKLIAIGRNYPGYTRNPGKEGGKVPAAFIKTLSSLAGPERDIVKPAACKELDYETELAVVIGKKCKHVREEDAYSVVAGYTIVNDITARDVGRLEREGGHLFLGKTYDTFAPMGPWMVTRDAIPDPMHLRIQTRVNGETRQDGNTKDMIWSIPKLIAYMSQITLMPGDVISTGSPGGGGLANPEWLLKSGDVIEAEIEGIGTLRNAVVDERTT
ncbi:MAG: fumarylacetoacetate hydrolase family protein [Betaproteobacteria bacterium]|nr:fumarylacetoacetate hydrolase family protein [Betaproteobacteria bacterium]